MALLALLSSGCGTPNTATMTRPGRFRLREAPKITLPWETDSNSPAHWSGDTLYIFNSNGYPYRCSGSDLFNLNRSADRVAFQQTYTSGGRWLEATYKDDDGRLYGWYHDEPSAGCSDNEDLVAPQIGALVSYDDGATWQDLGGILEAPAGSFRCDTGNRYFSGGNGDCSVILDRKGEYFYFFFSTYHKDPAEQGVSVARMRYADRKDPGGKVWKWRNGQWNEPGLGGRVTPIFPATTDWHRAEAKAFWGPSIHWNTYLNQYVILINRAMDKDWSQEGIYITFNPELSDPRGWITPQRVLDGGGWYPQVIGIDSANRETDKLAGRVARLFVAGESHQEIVFLRPGESE